MNEKNILKAEILKLLSDNLIKYKFQSNKKLGEFIYKNKIGWDKFQVIFIDRNDRWELNPAVLKRINIVEDIYHKFSCFEEKYKKGTPTIGTSIEDYKADNGQYRFDLVNEEQIKSISKSLLLLFEKEALPFFDKFATLKDLDDILNNTPEDTALTGSITKGSKALILARLTNRANYAELKDFYYNYYRSFCSGFYLSNYINLVRYLDNESTLSLGV